MDVAQNNVVGVGNNYLKDHQFLCKMSLKSMLQKSYG
jgi:hypothetical protein